jgi:isoquinoline 1-oxidoreductase beta subunit
MKYAAMARAPFGATLKDLDDSVAKVMPGVIKVKQIATGVAVIADSFWQAKQGRDALKLQWHRTWRKSSDELLAEYRASLNESGHKAESRGNATKALAKAAQVIEAEFEFPFLAHAAMEPLNCTVHDQGGRAELWTGSQQQTLHLAEVVEALGYDGDNIRIHNQQIGGSFGRRTSLDADYLLDAVYAAQGEPWPVNMTWTREDDMRAGNYRPMFLHKARLGLDEQGLPSAWMHRVAGQTVMLFPLSKVDSNTVEGLVHQPYAVENFRVEIHNMESPVPTLWWRSTGYGHNGMVVESLIDEAAQLAGQDPIQYRKRLLAKHPRMIQALERAAALASWGEIKLAEGQGMGVALVESFETVVVQIARVTVKDKSITVDKVWCVVDCGFAYNPLNVTAQLEGGIIFGLSSALAGGISLKDGLVEQSNFHDNPILRIDQIPDIEVEIINSGAKVGGIGEVGTPPIAPAVANAVYAATGQRLRSLPLQLA